MLFLAFNPKSSEGNLREASIYVPQGGPPYCQEPAAKGLGHLVRGEARYAVLRATSFRVDCFFFSFRILMTELGGSQLPRGSVFQNTAQKQAH